MSTRTMRETAAIRAELRRRGFTGSVRNGRGTAYCWIDVQGSDAFGRFTSAERATLLEALGEAPMGNLLLIAPNAERSNTSLTRERVLARLGLTVAD